MSGGKSVSGAGNLKQQLVDQATAEYTPLCRFAGNFGSKFLYFKPRSRLSFNIRQEAARSGDSCGLADATMKTVFPLMLNQKFAL